VTRSCQDSRDGPDAVLSEMIATVSLSAVPVFACSEQLAHSRTVAGLNCGILKPGHPPVSSCQHLPVHINHCVIALVTLPG